MLKMTLIRPGPTRSDPAEWGTADADGEVPGEPGGGSALG